MDFEAQWKRVMEKDALLQAALRQNLQRDISAEFEKMKTAVEKINESRILRGMKDMDVKLSELSIQCLNTTISFHFRAGNDPRALSSSIQVTQGKRGPIEYFGARSSNGNITWQLASGIVVFEQINC